MPPRTKPRAGADAPIELDEAAIWRQRALQLEQRIINASAAMSRLVDDVTGGMHASEVVARLTAARLRLEGFEEVDG